MRQLLAVAMLGSILAFTASAALASENADPKLFQFPEQHEMVGTTGSAQGVLAGPATELTPVNNHEK